MGIAGQLFLQIPLILIVGRLVGLALRRLRQPLVVGEMVAGVMLGPSLFGLLASGLFDRVFPTTLTVRVGSGALEATHPSMTVLFAVGQLGLILYMFSVGARLEPVMHFALPVGLCHGDTTSARRLSLGRVG